MTVGSLAAAMLFTHAFNCSSSASSRRSISSMADPLRPDFIASSFSVAYFTCTERSMNSKRAWMTSSRPHELFSLDQDVLSDTDLSEVVQEACVSKLLELVLSEVDVGELAGCDLGDLAGEPRGQAFHPTRMTRGARVSLLDGGHARLHKTVEQRLDGVEQGLVVQRDRGLPGDRLDHLHVIGLEADDLGLHDLDLHPRLESPPGVDDLDGAHDVVVVVAHGHGEHRLGAVSELRIEALATHGLPRWRVVCVVVNLALAD